MNCSRNYENMLNFVKVMPKILLFPFFRDMVYFHTMTTANTACLYLGHPHLAGSTSQLGVAVWQLAQLCVRLPIL